MFQGVLASWMLSAVLAYMFKRHGGKTTFCLLLVRAEKYRFKENLEVCSNCISPCFCFERHKLLIIGT